MSSGWFDYTEPFRTTYSQGDQGVYNTYTLVPGGYGPRVTGYHSAVTGYGPV